jgi:hypothetical protein
MWRAGVLALIGCGRLGFDAAATAADAATDADLAAVCATAPLGHWKLDEVSGATIADSAGDSDGLWTDLNDGDVATEALPGRRGGALSFDTGRSILVPGFTVPAEGTFAAWLTSTFDDTIEMAAHPMVIDTPVERTTISFADNAAYGLRTNGVSWQATYIAPADLAGWFHLAATWSASGAQLYVDGVPVGVPGTADARSTSPTSLYIGTRQGLDRWWFGLMDDLRIYDRALTAAEVAALYACP